MLHTCSACVRARVCVPTCVVCACVCVCVCAGYGGKDHVNDQMVLVQVLGRWDEVLVGGNCTHGGRTQADRDHAGMISMECQTNDTINAKHASQNRWAVDAAQAVHITVEPGPTLPRCAICALGVQSRHLAPLERIGRRHVAKQVKTRYSELRVGWRQSKAREMIRELGVVGKVRVTFGLPSVVCRSTCCGLDRSVVSVLIRRLAFGRQPAQAIVGRCRRGTAEDQQNGKALAVLLVRPTRISRGRRVRGSRASPCSRSHWSDRGPG